MNSSKAEVLWRNLGLIAVLAMLAFTLTVTGCPGPTPPDEKKSETAGDGGTPKDDAQPKDDAKPTDDAKPKDDPPGRDDPPTRDDPKPTDDTTDKPPKKTVSLSEVKPAAKGVASPLDASPGPDGKFIYYTAFKADTTGATDPTTDGEREGALYKVAADGSGTPTELAGGFGNPTGLIVSKDGSTIYVADSGAAKTSDDGKDDADADKLGAIYSVPSAGGNKTMLGGTKGYQPKSLDLYSDPADQIYFSGVDPADDKAGVFRIPAAGGTINVVSKDAKIVDGGGVAVDSAGVVYVAETIGGAGGNTSAIFKIENGTLTEFVDNIKVGYPAGIALTKDDEFLFVSGINPNSKTAQVYKIATKDGSIAATVTKGIDTNTESAGLHRAHNKNQFAWANAAGYDDDGKPAGTVYFLTTNVDP